MLHRLWLPTKIKRPGVLVYPCTLKISRESSWRVGRRRYGDSLISWPFIPISYHALQLLQIADIVLSGSWNNIHPSMQSRPLAPAHSLASIYLLLNHLKHYHKNITSFTQNSNVWVYFVKFLKTSMPYQSDRMLHIQKCLDRHHASICRVVHRVDQAFPRATRGAAYSTVRGIGRVESLTCVLYDYTVYK